MERRSFIKNTAFFAVAVSAYGFINFDGNSYVGDCETTTDILGPFYRPNSPVRNNLVIKGEAGDPIELRGIIRHKDCVTPYQKAKIELWHCDGKGIYDNTSAEYRYRGTTYSDENGRYSFNTIYPVPYEVGDGRTRPAHFHLMITAAGYQPLVTQLYFNGDKHISSDPWASSSAAKSRILDISELKNGMKKVTYDVSMSEILHAEAAAIDKLTGVYTDKTKKDKSIELINKDNTLWMKNEAFGNKFEYIGDNTFEEAGNPPGYSWKLHFELLPSNVIQLTESSVDNNSAQQTIIYLKEK
jgi:protocatechuate 3,4-dioxygenase beta subunit